MKGNCYEREEKRKRRKYIKGNGDIGMKWERKGCLKNWCWYQEINIWIDGDKGRWKSKEKKKRKERKSKKEQVKI